MLRMRHGSVLPIVLIALALAISASSPGVAARKNLKASFQVELDALRRDYKFPGATAAYILPDGTVEVVATGLADVEAKTPMTPNSRMLAASIGKSFVAATALALVQEGVLHLNDPVSKWLGDRPWFKRVPNHDSITLQQLLNHSAGLPDHVHLPSFERAEKERWNKPGNPFPPEYLVSFILDQPALFPAGQGWSYTDTGYILVGMIIEKATGHTYYEEATRRFLKPLHLDLTSPSNTPNLPGLAAGYMEKGNAFGMAVKTTVAPGVMGWNPAQEWTGGGMVSNPRDLVVWAKALYEGRAMKGPYLKDLMHAVPIQKGDPSVEYGDAVAIYHNGPLGPTYGHGGWIPGYSSSMRYYPKYRIAVSLQINTDAGMVEHHRTLLNQDMEVRLAKVVADSLKK
jgi:D-alanyl-D-alanine carboxypeptidase